MIGWLRSRLSRAADRVLAQAELAYAQGALKETRRWCMQALRAAPEHPRALFLLASVATDEKRIDEGLMWANRALKASPSQAAPHYALGRIWEAAARYPEAEASYRQALALAPRDAKAHNNLGAVLYVQGRLDAALECYRKALEIDPTQPQANQNYAAIANDARAHEIALEGYRRQAAANPRDAAALRSLASMYEVFGRTDEALASFDRAIALEPQNAEGHFGRAFVLLARGEYAEGWKEYEWRWRIEGLNDAMRRFTQPLWRGEPLAGGVILIHGESGLGDMVQFVRYAPLVAARGVKVVVECQPTLQPLVASVQGVHATVAQGAPLPSFTAHIPLITLPGVFGTTLGSIPWDGPYVHPDARRVSAWRSALSSSQYKVGLVWRGNPTNLGDRQRSLTLAELAPLGDVRGVELYSLQKGSGADEAVSPPAGLRLTDLGPRLRDFSDTAAVVSLLDLVISIDTSVAHLAGAMGAPVWVLLAHSADWRYHLSRSDNPWYPGMRLFRQPRFGDWATVVAEVADALRSRTT